MFNYDSGVARLDLGNTRSGDKWLNLAHSQFCTSSAHSALPLPSGRLTSQGIVNGGAGVRLTPLDMVKIGELYLNHGAYNGAQVVSEEWIVKATTRKMPDQRRRTVRTGVWILLVDWKRTLRDYFFANGWGGQFIVVVPDIKLVVVATNVWSGVPVATANAQWYGASGSDSVNQIIPLY